MALHRAGVLRDIMRMLPPPVLGQVEKATKEVNDLFKEREGIVGGGREDDTSANESQSSTTSNMSPGGGYTRELDTWVSLAHQLAAEVASLHAQLQEGTDRPKKAATLLRLATEQLIISEEKRVGPVRLKVDEVAAGTAPVSSTSTVGSSPMASPPQPGQPTRAGQPPRLL